MATEHRPIEELDLFRLFEEVAKWAWNTSHTWSPHIRNNFGVQLTEAADSVGANLVEGDGRFGSSDAIRFFIIARASARETRLWIHRAVDRNLVSQSEGQEQIDKLVQATKLLNLLINYRRAASNKAVKEGGAIYLPITEDSEEFLS